jgi:hypothetical protein
MKMAGANDVMGLERFLNAVCVFLSRLRDL